MKDQKIGEVTHFYTGINVAIVKLEGKLSVGDKVIFEGATTDFEQEVDDMEFDHEKLQEAEAGQEVGIKVKERVREGDEVYLA